MIAMIIGISGRGRNICGSRLSTVKSYQQSTSEA